MGFKRALLERSFIRIGMRVALKLLKQGVYQSFVKIMRLINKVKAATIKPNRE